LNFPVYARRTVRRTGCRARHHARRRSARGEVESPDAPLDGRM